jgi:hypothetical protein
MYCSATLIVPCWTWKKVQEISWDQHSSTYLSGGVALESTGVDLDVCTIISIDCSALKKFHVQETSADHNLSTYDVSGVAVERRIMDNNSSSINANCSSSLEVVCGAPGHRAKI